MSYRIAEEQLASKKAITSRCQGILGSTTDGGTVSNDDVEFLLALFMYHDEWDTKHGEGVIGVTCRQTPHGTRCFYLQRAEGSEVDISFRHASKQIPTQRSNDLLPQGLLDYRAAARTAIKEEVRAFRDKALFTDSACPISGTPLERNNSAVDHEPPATFDQLLYDFTSQRGLNPLAVEIASIGGTVATFADDALASQWAIHHKEHAQLRLISKIANAQLPKPKLAWQELCRLK